MIETILQIQKYVYPFDEGAGINKVMKVQDSHTFANEKELQEKKKQMQAKNKLINTQYFIKLLKIYQEDDHLHYIYQYIPYSISGYINKHYTQIKPEIFDMSSKLLLKKISYELTLLISYLAKIKIEVELAYHNLGLTQDQKLKLYVNAACKMGHKTQISLIAYYKQCKERILTEIQQELLNCEANMPKSSMSHPNFVIKGNKLIFPEVILGESLLNNESLLEQPGTENPSMNMQNGYDTFWNSSTEDSNVFKPNQQFSSYSNNQYQKNSKNNLRQTQSPSFDRSFLNKEPKPKPSKQHKHSFQFGSSQIPFDKFNRKRRESYHEPEEDKDDARSYTHSKSIRIQLQQKTEPREKNIKKQRKDSYKVKITTYDEYELDDCDPEELFLGKKFSQPQPQPEKDESNYEFEQNDYPSTPTPNKFEEEKMRSRKSSFQFFGASPHFPSPKKKCGQQQKKGEVEKRQKMQERKEKMQERKELNEKIKQAKEKAADVLRYMKAKRTLSSNYN